MCDSVSSGTDCCITLQMVERENESQSRLKNRQNCETHAVCTKASQENGICASNLPEVFHACNHFPQMWFSFSFSSLHAFLNIIYFFKANLLKRLQHMNRKCCVTGQSRDRGLCRRSSSLGDENITIIFPRACTIFSPWGLYHFTSLPPLGH